jgi:hypothetical protein
MALELIRYSDSRLDRSQFVRFMNSYQSVAPLTIGELWAWPSVLTPRRFRADVDGLPSRQRDARGLLAARSSPHRSDDRRTALPIVATSEPRDPRQNQNRPGGDADGRRR